MGMRAAAVLVFVVGAVMVTPRPARAGGWAVVTLDAVPAQARAGEVLRLGLMVRQHGVTPIDEAFGGAMRVTLSASNRDSGESLRADARKADTVVGHFVVDVAFPSAGTWNWEIRPAPFDATKFQPLAVLPPSGAVPATPDTAAATAGERTAGSAVTAADERLLDAVLLRWLGGALLVAAGALLFARFRPAMPWRLPPRSG